METTAEVRSGIAFAREEFDVRAWSSDIMRRHWEELGHSPELPLAPDFDMYQALHDANRLRIYTVRVDDWLVGYAVFLLGVDVLLKMDTTAVCNLLYLDKGYRRGFTGTNLLKFADRCLQEQDGVVSIAHAVSVRNPSLSILLERMDYRKEEEIWTRRIGR